MRTFKINRDELVMLVIKISTAIILGLLLFDALNVMAQPIPNGYDISQENNLREKVRQIYTSQIGIREKPVNSGPQVEKYLKYVGLGKGNPWCAAFVCWSLGKAGVYNPRSGWSPDLFAGKRVIWASSALPLSSIKNQESLLVSRIKYQESLLVSRIKYQESRLGGVKLGGLTLNTVDWIPTAVRCACPPLAGVGGGSHACKIAAPSTGDIFGLYFPEKGRIAHVGFIDNWDGTWMVSVEGNTNVAGSREGDGVYRKRRLVKSVYKVARYINH